MTGSTWVWRLGCAAAVAVGLASPGRAEDKDKKEAGKGGEAKKVIVIQLDASKVPPDVLRKLMELSRNTADDRKGAKGRKGDDDEHAEKGEKGRKGDDDDREGEKGRKGDDDHEKKGEKGKPNLIQIDLNKLSPELARRLKEELSKQKGGR